ncbi:hypothetical protein FPZ12_018215 [Amycolatopsis acidicola]|uniref:WXG100 family type VII secretion target n=1 Tax=Amycolatopsis acidicola TaxID=2596893 RepID=A0A5N0V4S8_9PSEU|nr:WXG100 family type VII secretion target [Amycolatopsis acidicola]KAA9160151.1 hypothetical protein FPZ12_018215 [Amycolatopsis acidicola]
MTDPMIKVSGAVSDMGSSTTTKAGQLIQLFEDLKKDAMAIAGEAWAGQAQQAFERAQAQWTVKANGLGNAHSEVGSAVVNNVENLINADIRAAGFFGG